MRRIVTWNLVATVAAAGLLVIALGAATADAQSQRMLFGMDLGSIDLQTNAGAKPDMGVIWVGPWTLTSGWGGPDAEFQKAYAAGVTPVVQYYYWGDDISQSCLEKGCRSALHNADKNKANWTRLAEQLAQHLQANMKGRAVVIILETEFNKGDVVTYEPLDGYLVEKADYLRQAYPASEIVLGLGNWGHDQWGTWDRAAAASDATGLQGMRASTRNTADSYQGLAQATLDGVRKLQDVFHKPVYITDIALSSYPEPDYLVRQERALQPFFARMGEFKALGVKGMLYRGLLDSPTMDTKNYFGEAERHWGLAWVSNQTQKPAMKVWVGGVQTERSATSTTAPPPPPPPTFAPSFEVKAPNEWWQEVFIHDTGGQAIAGVHVRRDGGAWQAMSKSSWGAWTSSYNTKAGSQVEFLATTTAGPSAQSLPFTWMDGQLVKGSASAPSTPTPTTSSSTTASTSPSSTPASASSTPTTAAATTTSSTAASAFAPSFEIKAPNEWWQEVFIQNADGHSVSRVDVRRDAGAWQTMSKSSWGAWTSSYNTKAGSKVEFLATTSAGAKAQSMPFTWMNGETVKATAANPSPATTTTAGPTSTTSSSTTTSTTTTASPTPTTTSPTPSLPVTVFSKEAEAFASKSTGRLVSDASASGGAYWKLDKNGHVSNTFTTNQGTHRTTVWVRGEASFTDSPRMQIRIDGQIVKDVKVPSGAWTAYTMDRSLTTGSHEIRIVYTNDSSGFLSDRNLLVDHALVQRMA